MILGYAYRNAGQMELAFKHYGGALQLNPRHRGAHEDPARTLFDGPNWSRLEEHLAALQKICLLRMRGIRRTKKEIHVYRKRAGK